MQSMNGIPKLVNLIASKWATKRAWGRDKLTHRLQRKRNHWVLVQLVWLCQEIDAVVNLKWMKFYSQTGNGRSKDTNMCRLTWGFTMLDPFSRGTRIHTTCSIWMLHRSCQLWGIRYHVLRWRSDRDIGIFGLRDLCSASYGPLKIGSCWWLLEVVQLHEVRLGLWPVTWN